MNDTRNSASNHLKMRAALKLIGIPLQLLGLLMLLVTFTPLVSWWAGLLAGSWNDPKGEVLIVLAGSGPTDGILGESSYLRSQYAVLAYREGWVRTVVISGGGTPPIATAMRDFIVCHGVPAERVITETGSQSTHESATQLRSVLQNVPGRKVLLTSDYHMFRARRALARAGIEVSTRPIPDARKRAARWLGRWPAFLTLIVEYVKIGYYFIRGWI